MTEEELTEFNHLILEEVSNGKIQSPFELKIRYDLTGEKIPEYFFIDLLWTTSKSNFEFFNKICKVRIFDDIILSSKIISFLIYHTGDLLFLFDANDSLKYNYNTISFKVLLPVITRNFYYFYNFIMKVSNVKPKYLKNFLGFIYFFIEIIDKNINKNNIIKKNLIKMKNNIEIKKDEIISTSSLMV